MDEIYDRAEAESPANGVAVPERADGNTKAHPGSANLRPPWPKGVSGNPGGRPKGQPSLTDLLEALLEQNQISGKKLPDGKQLKHMVVEALVKAALKGGSRHIIEIYNRIDGKLIDRVEHAGSGGGPIVIDAFVQQAADIKIDAWRQKKRAEISARPKGPPGRAETG